MKNNKVLLMVIGIAILIVGVVGVSFAFFNYTRTGSPNTLSVGRIAFSSSQNNIISLENAFPTNKNNLNNTNSDTVTINITGDTDYSEGIEYKVTLEAVNNTINGKEVPISIKATATNLGTEDSNYYTNRENKTKIYLLNEEGEAYNGKYIAVGYIPAGSTGVEGSIDITAFIDTNKVAITDTIENGPIVETGYDNGTTNDWIAGREVFTTTEWNSFVSSETPLSFKVKVEANEGIWVEQEKFLTMKNLNDIAEWTAISASITRIEFHKDGIAPTNPVTSFDVTDNTSDPSKGRITLYTVDDGLGNNTYKAIVVANDTIYAPEDSSNLFSNLTYLYIFDSRNFKVDNVTNMSYLFANASYNFHTTNALSVWNTSNVQSFERMFSGCRNLFNIKGLENWDVSNATNMRFMFFSCQKLTELSPISNWNVSNVTEMTAMFMANISLVDAQAINDWNINASANFTGMFRSTPVHPEFTKFPNGTWDAQGTFTPNA